VLRSNVPEGSARVRCSGVSTRTTRGDAGAPLMQTEICLAMRSRYGCAVDEVTKRQRDPSAARTSFSAAAATARSGSSGGALPARQGAQRCSPCGRIESERNGRPHASQVNTTRGSGVPSATRVPHRQQRRRARPPNDGAVTTGPLDQSSAQRGQASAPSGRDRARSRATSETSIAATPILRQPRPPRPRPGR